MNAQERNANIEATKAKYGDNHWWDSDDPRTRAYHQMHEEILLLPFQQFHVDIETLLGHPVFTHEFGVRWEALQQEAEEAWKQQ